MPNHLVAMAYDPGKQAGLDDLPPEVAARAMVVKRADRIDIECVVRGYITGSAWAEYQAEGTIGGAAMPAGMREGDPFPGDPVHPDH